MTVHELKPRRCLPSVLGYLVPQVEQGLRCVHVGDFPSVTACYSGEGIGAAVPLAGRHAAKPSRRASICYRREAVQLIAGRGGVLRLCSASLRHSVTRVPLLLKASRSDT